MDKTHYTPEEIQALVTAVQQYVVPGIPIPWRRIIAEHPELQPLLDKAGGQLKYVRAVWYRNCDPSKPIKPTITKLSAFSPEQDARLLAITSQYKQYDRLPWERLDHDHALDPLLADGFTIEQIRNRYSYIRKKEMGTLPHQKRQALKANRKAMKSAAAKPAMQKYYKEVALDDYRVDPRVDAARQAEVERQKAAATPISYCPHCGKSIAKFLTQ